MKPLIESPDCPGGRPSGTVGSMSWARRVAVLPRGWNAVAAVVFAGAAFAFAGLSDDVSEHDGLVRSDPHWLAAIVSDRTPMLVRMAKVVSEVGAAAVLAVVAVAAAVALWAYTRRLAIAAAPLVSLGLAGAVVSFLKPFVDRARPPVALHLVNENEPSFPSGHTTDSTALLITLGLIAIAITAGAVRLGTRGSQLHSLS